MMNIRKKLGYILITTFALIPSIYLYFLNTDIQILTFISKASALSGIVFYCYNFILSTRSKFFEEIFMGLDKVYKAHRLVGIMSLILLLLHPLTLLIRYKENFTSLFLPPEKNIDVVSGVLAFDIFLFILIVTLFLKKIKYPNWKKIHKFLGLSLALASIHTFLIPSNVQSGFLRIYILSFCVLAILSFLYRTFFFKLLVRRYEYKVVSTINIKDKVTEVTMAPVGKQMKHLPGQFAFFSFSDRRLTEEIHPFTIVPSNNPTEVRILAKRSGDYTSKLNELNPSTKVLIEGPYGRFGQYAKSGKQVWIAGGIGITPFISLSKAITNQDITLIYTVSEESEYIYLEELKSSKIKLIQHTSKEKGRLNISSIKSYTSLNDADILLCGPIPMIKDLRSQLKKEGINPNNIHSEEFAFK